MICMIDERKEGVGRPLRRDPLTGDTVADNRVIDPAHSSFRDAENNPNRTVGEQRAAEVAERARRDRADDVVMGNPPGGPDRRRLRDDRTL
ncbi:MAG TPA: hypothetical protein VNZ52_08690 [Candidatus Thermoplasmatota archaeon]|nr:hypothetical protein [Candidatus Thermoplasmatota archaeon]